MKICIALDSFKESMTALEACNSVKDGFINANLESQYFIVPMADGGEGTVKALIDCTDGEIVDVFVKDPLFRNIKASYGIFYKDNKKIGVIEMAEAGGLNLLKPEERNPMITSTYGVGELILSALNNNVDEILLAIGGSCTNDGGVGMAAALGAKFYNKDGELISYENLTGGTLSNIYEIDTSNLNSILKNIKVTVACDVTNPLTGDFGASKIFAKQKGATVEQINILDNNLKHFAKVVLKSLDKDIENVSGAGAAGGLGGGSIAFLNAELKSGIDIVIDYTNLEEKIKQSDIVITGEGKIDKQTIFGKVPFGVATIAKKYNKKVIALAGCLDDGHEVIYDNGIDCAFSIVNNITDLPNALKDGKKNLKITARNIGVLIKMNME